MNEDCLKLTTYFGERQRSGDRFVAEAMLDLFGEHQIASSILLRGIAGFGPRHHLRTDQTLSMSEDPPVAVIAVDTRNKIDELLDPVLAIKARGLLTLERARLLTDDIGPVELSDELHEATKLTVYVGRKERVYGVPAYIALCDLMYRRELAGASVFLGVDGTAHGHRQRARFFDRNTDVPVMIIAVGSGERIGRVLPEIGGLIRRPLITLERIRVCKRDGSTAGTTPRVARHRRTRPVDVAEADGLYLRSRTPRRPTHPPRAGPGTPGSASPPAALRYCAGSGDFTAITNRTATSYFNSSAMSRRSPSSSTPRTTSPNLSM